jgi:cytidylate kinase
MKQNVIVTISRQYGSGGKEIAEIAAGRLGLRCYDRQILYAAAARLGGENRPIGEILEEAYDIPRLEAVPAVPAIPDGHDMIPYYNRLYREQAIIIRDIALKGGAVFVGRCADAILRDFPNRFSFFVCADDAFREKRAKEDYGISSSKEFQQEDRTRERYYSYYSGLRWMAPQNYDLVVNTSRCPPDRAAELILAYIGEQIGAMEAAETRIARNVERGQP